MEVHSETITIDTNERLTLIDITERIMDILERFKAGQGLISVFSLHTTTGVFISEVQAALVDDVKAYLRKVVDDSDWYKHNCAEFSDCERQNAAAHLRGMILGNTLSLPIVAGKVLLGQFQRIMFAELDGPRQRELHIQVMAG